MTIAGNADYGDGPSTGGNRATGSGIVTGRDRSQSMTQARRHTFYVRMMRVALPLMSLALLATYASTVMKAAGVGANLPQISLPRIIPDQLAMANPHYEGFGKDGSTYVLDSKTAQQDPTSPTTIKLIGLSGTLVQPDKSETLFAAVRGDYNSTSKILELYDKIDVTSETGLKAQLTRATLTAKDSVLVTKEPVTVDFSGGSVHSNAMTMRHKIHEVTFVDNVVARMIPQKPDPSKVKDAAQAAQAAANGSALFQASDAPLDITSSRLDIKDASKTAIFTGNVKAIQNDQSLLTPELTVTYADPAAQTPATAAVAAASPTGKIQRIIAKGPVVMDRGATDHMTADALDFDAPAQAGSLLGSVVMSSGTDRHATSDRVDFDQAASTVILSGNVFVQQGKNELRGGRLFIDRATGHTLLTSPPGSAATGSRILAHMVRGDGSDKSKGKAKPKPPVAGADATAAGSFKTDPNAPIDIDAEQLDVNDTKKNAVFRGDVKAVQGDFVIKTPELVATYTGDMKLADVTSSDASAASVPKKAPTELTHIHANTKVNVTSKDGQSVDGDWADYDAKAGTIVVGGEVVLSKGGSMVRGTRLLIDTVSGESTIETAPNQAIAEPGGGGWSTTAPGAGEASNRGRPSAVFFPGELKEAADSKKEKEKAAAKAASGKEGAWKAKTAPPSAPDAAPQADN